MKIACLTDNHAVPPSFQGGCVAIGNFDGVHLGHRALLETVKRHNPSGIICFDPHPRRFFKPNDKSFLLTPLEIKTALLQQSHIDFIYQISFNQQLADLSPQDFVQEFLARRLGVKHAVVGHDFTYGHNRSGNVQTLTDAGKKAGFDVTIHEPVTDNNGQIISSTRARACISRGDFDGAQKIMGHGFAYNSIVIKGDQRGRTLGYPTANMNVSTQIEMPYGVYAVKIAFDDPLAPLHTGVANFGLRPMFKLTTPLLETFIFDFDRDIYGKNISIYPVKFLRPEMKFGTLDALKIQMAKDCEMARAVVKSPE